MINKLKKQEEINELIETWEEYQNAPKHFNVPLPEELANEYNKFYIIPILPLETFIYH